LARPHFTYDAHNVIEVNHPLRGPFACCVQALRGRLEPVMAAGSWSTLLFAETTLVAIPMAREPTGDGWVPVMASPNRRHAFALFSDEVDAIFDFTYHTA
jgi:hypothetical protein